MQGGAKISAFEIFCNITISSYVLGCISNCKIIFTCLLQRVSYYSDCIWIFQRNVSVTTGHRNRTEFLHTFAAAFQLCAVN